jgi:unsaturated chondroitin disaccharide hydrolase
MNLSLLYWASEEVGDERFKKLAMRHMNMALRDHIREDGSTNHVVVHDREKPGVIEVRMGQGYSPTSCWSRGLAWAVYGSVISYIHTGKAEYLQAAKKTADYFIDHCKNTDYRPLVDFLAPPEPVYYDSTAGMIAACGLIELSNLVPEYEKRMYFRAAMRLLRNIEKNFCDWNEDTDAVVTMGSERYDTGKYNLPIIYGDFFFTEALYKLRENSLLFW